MLPMKRCSSLTTVNKRLKKSKAEKHCKYLSKLQSEYYEFVFPVSLSLLFVSAIKDSARRQKDRISYCEQDKHTQLI